MLRIVCSLAACLAAGCAVASGKPQLLLHLTFDGTAEAAVSRGEPSPVAAEGLEFGPGRFGQAVRLTAAAGSRLAYAAKDNIGVRRGSMSFWIKRDAFAGANPQALLSLEPGKRPGLGRFAFTLERGNRAVGSRDDVAQQRPTSDLGPWRPETGVWEHWIATWSGRDRGLLVYRGGDGTREYKVYPTDEEINRIMPKSVGAAAMYAPDAEPPNMFFLGCSADGSAVPLEGWLDDVRIFDRPFTTAEVKRIFDRDRMAGIVHAPHFGLSDELRRLPVEVAAFGGTDLAGSVIELADVDGRVVAVKPCDAKSKCAVIEAKLPMGRYEYRLVRGGVVLARDSYTVLRAGNPYELPPTETPGVPKHLKHVKTVKADPAALSERNFRSVGFCTMRELDGQPYLESGKGDKDRFAIRFSLPTNVPLYMLEIVYPDDKFRTMDLVVQATDSTHGNKSGSGGDYSFAQGISTGGEFPNSMKMLSHRCLYWSGKSEDVTLVAMAWKGDAPAAVSEIRIYEVVDAALPVADVRTADSGVMGRAFGQFWEDPAVSGAMRFNMATPESFSEQIDRYAAVMRYCGQNLLSYPGGWYKGLITAANDPRRNTHVDHFLEGYYAKFEREGLYVMPSIEFIQVIDPPEIEPTADMITNGSLHSSQYPIYANGLPPQRFNHNLPPVCNFYHPKTRRQIEEMVRALVREGAPYKAFKGLSIQLYRDGAGWWGDITSGYNDYCIRDFERDTGIKVPVDRRDPLRGKAYYEWLMSNRKREWIDWRCDKFTEFYARMARILSDARPDLKLWFIAAPQFDAISELETNPDYYDESFASRTLKDAGFDGAKLTAAIPNAVLGVTVHPQRQRKRWYWANTLEKRERYTNLPATEGYYREIQQGVSPYVTCRDEFMEYDVRKIPAGSPRALSGDWFTEIGWRCSTVNAPGFHAMRYFAVPLRFGDVLGFTRGSFLVCDYGYEPLEARFAQAFRALPDVKMDDAPFTSDSADVVRVRTASLKKHRYYYAVNTDMKPAKVRFPVKAPVSDTVTGERHDTSVELSLAPYELRSFTGLEQR